MIMIPLLLLHFPFSEFSDGGDDCDDVLHYYFNYLSVVTSLKNQKLYYWHQHQSEDAQEPHDAIVYWRHDARLVEIMSDSIVSSSMMLAIAVIAP